MHTVIPYDSKPNIISYQTKHRISTKQIEIQYYTAAYSEFAKLFDVTEEGERPQDPTVHRRGEQGRRDGYSDLRGRL